MIKYLFFFLSLCSVVGAAGQMSVTRFEPLPHDLDAKVNYKRQNPNDGHPYALIKISTGLDCAGFTRFDFGSVGYGEIDCTQGTWVYAPASASRVSITHNVAGTLENYLLPAPLEAGVVYSMTLESGRVYTRVEATSNVGFLVVECNVAGATLRIGSEGPALMAGTRFTKTLLPGAYDYEITAAGHEPERGRMTIPRDGTYTLKADMIPSNGTLRLHSVPGGASVFVDGQLQAERTPATLSFYKGVHTIQLSKDLYHPVTREVTVDPGKTTELSVTLEPDFGTVEVKAAGVEDSIFIDKVFLAKGTWRGDVKSGLHVLETSRASYTSFKKDFSVTAGQRQKLSTTALEPLYGMLRVEVADSRNATVYVDGEKRSDMTPCFVKDVLIGKHALRLVPDDKEYQPFEKEIMVREGKIAMIKNPIFKKKPSNLPVVLTMTDGSEKTYGEPPLTEIWGMSFYKDEKIKTVNIPYGVSRIGNSAFEGCRNMQSVTFPDGLETIGEKAFYNCDELQSVTFPDGLKAIGEKAFYGCWDLKAIVFPEGLETIGKSAFCVTNIKHIAFSNSIKNIGEGAFSYTDVEKFVWPEGVSVIKNRTFECCHKLRTVFLPAGVTEIGRRAFEDCDSLKEIYCRAIAPPSVTCKGDRYWYTFRGVSKRKVTVYVPRESVKAYKKDKGWKKFKIVGHDF